jgi:adenosylcobinamide-GDP ribazoletransferase
MFAGLRLATGLLTIIPVRPPDEITPANARAAMLLAPVAVMPVALLAGLAGWGSVLIGMPALLAGVVTVLVVTLGTRALHLDGLADTVDGLGSGKDAEAALKIMKASDIGPMGVVALVLVLFAQVFAAAALLPRPWGWVQVVVVVIMARAALLFGCVKGVPAARPDGLGALVAGTVPAEAAVVGWVVLGGVATLIDQVAGQPYWLPLVVMMVVAGVVAGLVQVAINRFGGITGDVLGALVEVAATLLLVAATISLPPLVG